MFDVAIVGGGPAGLSAALALGRARRPVLLVDSGAPRNAASDAAHGFLSRDDEAPEALRRKARDQLRPYPVQIEDATVLDVLGGPGVFEVGLDHRRERARRVLLATGVDDVLPDVQGMQALWGRGIHHCPYCHGWESRDQALAVHGREEEAYQLALLLRRWSQDVALLTDGEAPYDAAHRDRLHRNGVVLHEGRIARLEGEERLERVVFEDGGSLARQGLFLHPSQVQRSRIPERLGCDLVDGLVEVDEEGRTTVEGVYAAGDMTSRFQQIVAAAAQGARTAVAINVDLLREETR